MSKRLRIWLFVLLGSLLTSTSLLAEGVITMTTSRAVGETIKLTIKASGNVTIEGAQDTGRKEYYGQELYSLSSQTVTIRGDVTYLGCYENQLTSLNVSGCTSLRELHCYKNRLTSLDVSGCTSLTTLNCWWNSLTSLKVSGCTSLTELWCYSNQLTSLDVSGCTTLTQLYCYGNQINGEGMTKLVNSLPDRMGLSCGTLRVIDYDRSKKRDENWSSFADVATASEKNWEVLKHVEYVHVGSYWESYAGVGEGVITMTTSKAVWEKVKLRIEAKGDVFIEGVSEIPYPNSDSKNYTLASQTITIRGDVTSIDCDDNQLTNLDLSKNTALTLLSCNGNQLTSVDVSGCTSLTELSCYGNQLTSLDVSKNIALTELYCGRNQLTSLDVSQNIALTELYCGRNQLTSVDVSGCTSLTKLYCGRNQLTSLNASGCTALTEVDCQGNLLTSLNVSGCTALTKLDCSKNQLTSLNVSGCIALTQLTCYDNPLTRIDLSNCKLLKEFTWYGGKLTSLDVSGCTALTKLECYDNQINGENMTKLVTSLPSRKGMSAGSLVIVNRSEVEKNLCRPSDIAIAQEKNWTLKWENGKSYKGIGEGVITMITSRAVGRTVQLRIEANSDVLIEGVRESPQQYLNNYTLTSQTITIRGDVTELFCNDNQLTSLDVSKNTTLTMLSCNKNQLTRLDLSGCIALTELDCSDNPLTSLNLSNCKSLKEFTWNKTKLASLDLSGCTALTTLDCRENQLTSLNVTGCTSLTKLSCANNQLASLDMSKNIALTELSCYGNQLTSLDVSKNTALTELSCYGNQLTSLDVSKNTALTKLYCYSNQINGEAMTKLVNSLPDRKGMSSGTLGVVKYSSEKKDQNWCSFADVATASEKNWAVEKRVRDSYWTSYPGVGEGVITMTTSRAVGEKIKLGIVANGDVVIEGVSEMPELDQYRYDYNYTLTSQTITIRGDVTELAGAGNQLTSLDVSGCTTLTKLDCNNNQLTSLDLSGRTALTKLDCSDNPLTSIDLSNCKSLKEFTWNKKELASLDVSGCTSLTKLECNENQLTSLKVSGCTALTKLDCNVNQLPSLNVSGCTALTELDCSKNQLTSLDVSGCTSLTKLVCYKNRLKGEAMTQMVVGLSDRSEKESGSLYVVCDESDENTLLRSDVLTASRKNWRVFKYIVNTGKSVLYSGAGGDDEIVMSITKEQYLAGGIRLAILADGDVTIEGVHEKRIFTDGSEHTYTLAGTQITIRGNVSELDCSKNQLTNIDVSKSTSLWTLKCSDNKLTSLNASGSSLLTEVNCSNNRLTSLDVSGCASLETLECDNNHLTSLNISGCVALKTLYCYSNCINGEAMTKLVNSLPDRKGMSSGTLGVVKYSSEKKDQNWCSFADVATASEKNWSVQKYGSYSWESYPGVGEGVITMTTSKAVGGKVELEFKSNGNVVIEGVSEMPQLGRNRNSYTLTSQTIIIRGDVTKLDCFGNQLTSLNASGCTALTELDCQDNRLTSLNVSGCTALTKLDCQDNQLSGLDLTQNSTLTELDCSRNKLESLDLSACTRLKSLTCYRNKIRGNAVAQLVESLPDRYGKEPGKFYFVYYSVNEYEENFCYRPAVGRANDKNWRPQKGHNNGSEDSWEDYFGVKDEGVVMMRTAQEVGSQITLTLEANGDVAIDGVKGVPVTDGKPHQYTLISQDVTIRGYVTKLHCSGNKLTSLDLSTTVPLVELDCSNNQLTALDVSHNAAVTSLTCYRNQIKGDAMAQLIKGLPQLPLRSTHLFGIVSNAADEGNVFLKADVERVRDKGWSPMKWDEERHQYEPYAGKETETFAVTLTKEGKGTITATGADDLTAVPYGTELTIVATPTEGYELISLTAGEEDILATKKVVVTDNVTVKATFDEATFAVTLTKEGEGVLNATGADDLKAVPYGTKLTITATPATGYELTALTANGEDILATRSFVVKGATEVKATFVDHTGVETTVTQQTQLYPNPATDHIIVEGVAPASEVTLHSLTGERLYAGRTDSRGMLQIDLTPYADGVYLVCVAGETYRVVVRR